MNVPIAFDPPVASVDAFIPEPPEQLAPGDAGKVRLFIGVPTYQATASIITSMSLIRLCASLSENGIDCYIKPKDGERAPRARNRICYDFLKSTYTHLLMMDADIGSQPKDVLGMLAANVHVIGSVYPIKQYHWQKIADAIDRAPEALVSAGLDYVVSPLSKPAQSFRTCVEVSELGTGFMLIKRETLEMMAKYAPSYLDDFPDNFGNRVTAFFFEGIKDDRWLSEDYWFCHQWRALGGRVWAWPWAKLAHAGNHIFQGEFERRVHSVNAVQPAAATQQHQQGE